MVWLAILASVVLSFVNPLIVKVSPAVALVRTDVRVDARIFPSKDNFRLQIILIPEGDESMATVSEMDLNENDPILHSRYYRDVTSGEYEVRVVLIRRDKTFTQVSRISVKPMN